MDLTQLDQDARQSRAEAKQTLEVAPPPQKGRLAADEVSRVLGSAPVVVITPEPLPQTTSPADADVVAPDRQGRMEPTSEGSHDRSSGGEATQEGTDPAKELNDTPAGAAKVRPGRRFVEALREGLQKLRKEGVAKKSARKQKQQDEDNKKANTRRGNPAKYVVPVIALGIVASLVAKHYLNGVTQEAVGQPEGQAHNAAVQQATALLDGAPQPTTRPAAASSTSASGPTSAQETTAQPPAPAAGYVPPDSPNEDPYLRRLKELKGEMKEGGLNSKSPTRLPAEIAQAEIPTSGGRRAAVRESGPGATAVTPSVPDEVEGEAGGKAGLAKDPLDRVTVVGTIKVETSGVSPYLVGPIRKAGAGITAFIYPKNADPLTHGAWYFMGDQTPDGWTVTQITADSVNVVSPRGRVHRINSHDQY